MARGENITTQNVNLRDKFEKKIAEEFGLESYFKGYSSNSFNFNGVSKIKVTQILPVAMQEYNIHGDANGANRTGPIREVQDAMQELEMGQTMTYSASIDMLNATDQEFIKGAAKVIRTQNREVVIPRIDHHIGGTLARKAGIKLVAPAGDLTSDNIVENLFNLRTALTNKGVPIERGKLFIASSYFALLCQNKSFINYEKVGTKAITRGLVGRIAGMEVVEVPDPRMAPGCLFVYALPSAFLAPMKIDKVRTLNNVQGVFGTVIDALYYYDCFPLITSCYGLASMWGNDTAIPDAPTATPDGDIDGAQTKYVAGTTSITLASETADAVIAYTLDGSDPRSSKTAQTYTAPIATAGWDGTYKLTAAAIDPDDDTITSGIYRGFYYPA